MSRRLPALPNLEHLRKQAKELLRELQRQKPQSKLADAQHAVGVEYGFTNWPELKARVEALAAQSPFGGTWRMNPAKSRRSFENPFVRPMLHIAVTGDTLTITDVVVDSSGREERGVNTIRADGYGHAVEHGYVLTTRWRGARVLETMVKKNGQQVSRLTYEVSPDGQNLTIAGSTTLTMATLRPHSSVSSIAFRATSKATEWRSRDHETHQRFDSYRAYRSGVMVDADRPFGCAGTSRAARLGDDPHGRC